MAVTTKGSCLRLRRSCGGSTPPRARMRWRPLTIPENAIYAEYDGGKLTGRVSYNRQLVVIWRVTWWATGELTSWFKYSIFFIVLHANSAYMPFSHIHKYNQCYVSCRRKKLRGEEGNYLPSSLVDRVN